MIQETTVLDDMKLMSWFPCGTEPTLISHFIESRELLLGIFAKGNFRIYVFNTFFVPLYFIKEQRKWIMVPSISDNDEAGRATHMAYIQTLSNLEHRIPDFNIIPYIGTRRSSYRSDKLQVQNYYYNVPASLNSPINEDFVASCGPLNLIRFYEDADEHLCFKAKSYSFDTKPDRPASYYKELNQTLSVLESTTLIPCIVESGNTYLKFRTHFIKSYCDYLLKWNHITTVAYDYLIAKQDSMLSSYFYLPFPTSYVWANELSVSHVRSAKDSSRSINAIAQFIVSNEYAFSTEPIDLFFDALPKEEATGQAFEVTYFPAISKLAKYRSTVNRNYFNLQSRYL